MKLNDLSNPFNNFDITSWSTNLVDKINKTLKRRNREEDQLTRPSKLPRLDSDNITDNNGITHDDHLHLTSTKLDEEDDILLNEKINDNNNDTYDDDDDAKANDAYWRGEDPADDRDDNVLAKHEFDKGYNDDSESEDDEKVDEEEDELDREEDELDGEGYDEEEYERMQNNKIDPRTLPSYEEEVVGQVDSEDNLENNREEFEDNREQYSEEEPENDEEDSQNNHTQEIAEHYNDYVYSDEEEEEEEEEDTHATTRNDAPIELSSDSE